MKKYSELREQEKKEMVEILSDYIISTKGTINKACIYAEIFNIDIKHTTLITAINNVLSIENPEKYEKVMKILNPKEYTPKEINSQPVKQAQNLVGGGVEKSTNIPEADTSSQKLNKSDLTQMSLNQIKEVILMALTYRTSFKNLAVLFHSTEEEIRKMFSRLPEYDMVLNYLDKETKNEDKINERVAYIHSFNYLKKKKTILKEIKKAKKNIRMFTSTMANAHVDIPGEDVANKEIGNHVKTTSEELQAILDCSQEILKKHMSLVDDSIVVGTMNKMVYELTESEVEAIARYRLKYSLPIKKIQQILGRDPRTIYKFEEELSKKDMIFKEKIERLNDYYQEKSNTVKAEYGVNMHKR